MLKTRKTRQRAAWGVMTFLAIGMTMMAMRYFSFNPDVFFPDQRETYLTHQFGIMLHIAGGVLALGIGPFQFLNRLRSRRPLVHRWLGRIYLIGILVGGLGGLYMAFFAYAGVAATAGFASLAVSWLFTGAMAYITIRQGDTETHRKWMVRNFALTFAGVTLRLEMFPLMMLFGATQGYEMVAWLCWVPNLLIAEAMLRGVFRMRRQPVAAGAGTD